MAQTVGEGVDEVGGCSVRQLAARPVAREDRVTASSASALDGPRGR